MKKNVTSLAEMLGFKHLQKKHAQWASTLKNLADMSDKNGKTPLRPIPPPLVREFHDSQIELNKFGDGNSSKVTSSMNVAEEHATVHKVSPPTNQI